MEIIGRFLNTDNSHYKVYKLNVQGNVSISCILTIIFFIELINRFLC